MENECKKRKKVRLSNYDYTTEGYYFITVCIHNQINILGNIINGEMIKNDKGSMIENYWNELTNKFTNIRLDKYVIMPNHIHGVIHVKRNETSIVDIIQWFKTMTTNKYIRNVKEGTWEKFEKKVWQRNYYEHIVRNEKELYQIRKYIEENPLKWEQDKFYYTDNYL